MPSALNHSDFSDPQPCDNFIADRRNLLGLGRPPCALPLDSIVYHSVIDLDTK